MKKRGLNAQEIMARVNADPKKRAAREKALGELAARETALREEARPILDDLKSGGISFEGPWQLALADRARAIPILLNHLPKPYSQKVRWGIALALGVPEVRSCWHALLDAFRREEDLQIQSSLASAIRMAATDAETGDLVGLLDDASLGDRRLFLLLGLGRSNDPRVVAALQRALNDPTLAQDSQKELNSAERRRAPMAGVKGQLDLVLSESIPRTGDELETSTDIEAKSLQPFLERLSSTVGGFGAPEVARVVALSDSLELNQEVELSFRVKCDNEAATLWVRVLADDEDTFGVFFFGTSKLVARIRQIFGDDELRSD